MPSEDLLRGIDSKEKPTFSKMSALVANLQDKINEHVPIAEQTNERTQSINRELTGTDGFPHRLEWVKTLSARRTAAYAADLLRALRGYNATTGDNQEGVFKTFNRIRK